MIDETKEATKLVAGYYWMRVSTWARGYAWDEWQVVRREGDAYYACGTEIRDSASHLEYRRIEWGPRIPTPDENDVCAGCGKQPWVRRHDITDVCGCYHQRTTTCPTSK